ncbi:MAG: 4'-phosphopantetheinyl transferase family protein [Acutalibacteraceae bacterium]
MKIDVKYLFIDKSYSWSNLSKYIKYISNERRQRIEHFVFEKDKITSLLAELLIRYEVMATLGIDNTAVRFSYNSFGKPHLYHFPDYHFSVSHTDGCIVFAGSDRVVGIDTEKIAAYDQDIACHFFVPQEIKFIDESKNKDFAFYDIWTKKESYLKMLGTGLSKPLQSFNVLSNELNKKFTTKKFPNHIITLCTDYTANGNCKIIFNEVKIYNLLELFDNCQNESI